MGDKPRRPGPHRPAVPPLRLTPSPHQDDKPQADLRAQAGKLDDQTTDDLLDAFSTMSRRISDLARELKCLGYFDEDDDRPKAA